MLHPRAEVSDKFPTTGTDKMTNAGGVGWHGLALTEPLVLK